MICLLYFVAPILCEHFTPVIVLVEICKLFANPEDLTSAFPVLSMSGIGSPGLSPTPHSPASVIWLRLGQPLVGMHLSHVFHRRSIFCLNRGSANAGLMELEGKGPQLRQGQPGNIPTAHLTVGRMFQHSACNSLRA